MRQAKQSTQTYVPVRMVLATDGVTGKTGLVYSTVTVWLAKNGAVAAQKTMVSGDLVEVDATNAPGLYWLRLSTTDTSTLGSLIGYLTASTCDPSPIDVEIVANLEADTYARIGSPAGASVSADIASVNAKTTNLPGAPASTGDVTGARDSIKGSGPNDITQVYSRLGSPAGASVSADVAAIKSDTVGAATSLQQILGLLGKNAIMDQITRSNGAITVARIRVYDNKTNADAAYASAPSGGTTGLLYTFSYAAAEASGLETKTEGSI